MRHLHFTLFFLIIVALTVSAYAELYRYVDEKGQSHWTDDLGQVPAEQRASVQRSQSVENEPETSKRALHQEESSEIAAEKKVGESETIDDISRDSLEKEKVDLEAQYQYLLEERQDLEKLKAETNDAKGRKELNRRITEYNTKSEQYEKQLNQFNKKVSAYNQKLQSKTSNSD